MMIAPDAIAKNVSRETFEKLEIYVATLLKWNASINLIDRKTESDLWHRHILDSHQLIQYIPDDARTLIDYGSGGGLPALVIAACLPRLSVSCAERDGRKCVFLTEAARLMELNNLEVCNTDVSAINGHFDMVTARAFTSLNTLLTQAIHHTHANSICLFPKGKTHATEIEQAKKDWGFTLTLEPSVTDSQARILRVTNLQRL